MGCSDSKPAVRSGGGGGGGGGGNAAEVNRLQAENKSLKKKLQTAEPSNGADNGQPKLSPRAKGLGSPRSFIQLETVNVGSIGKGRATRYVTHGQPPSIDYGQASGLISRARRVTLSDALQQAMPEGTQLGYQCNSDGIFFTPGERVIGGKPTTWEDVFRKASKISSSHPSIAAFTLASPIMEANNIMKNISGNVQSHLPDQYIDPVEDYKKYKSFETLLHRELLTLPKYQKIAFKALGTRLTINHSLDNDKRYINSIYAPGHVVTWQNPTSTTSRPSLLLEGVDVAQGKPRGSLLVIQSLNGRDVSALSCCPGESEIVFPCNTQFRTSDRISSAVETLLASEMCCNLENIDIIAMCEVRLVVWRDVLNAMDEVETACTPALVHLLELASETAEAIGRYNFDPVSQSYVLGCPTTELPPRGQSGVTIVHLVVEDESLVGLLRMVTHQLSAADVNEINADGRSPLHLALVHNNTPGAVHLLSKGATISSGTMADVALAAAAEHSWSASNRHTVERLLREINPQDIESVVSSPVVLKAAATQGTMRDGQPLIQLLCRKAKSQQLKYLNTAGMLTAACGSPNVEQGFLEWLVVEGSAKDNGTAVTAAVKAGNHAIIKDLRDLKVPLDSSDSDGRTALHFAASHGDMKGFVALLGAGAKIRQSDSHGWTLPHEAAYHGHLRILEKLNDLGAECDEPDVDGSTPLWWASDAGNNKVVQYLLEKCYADVNVLDSFAGSAPLIAAYNGHSETVELLAKYGADIDKANQQGRSPVWIAAAVGSIQTLEVLRKLNAKLNVHDYAGMTAAHAAAQEGWAPILEWLYNEGVDMDIQTNKGFSALHFAATRCRHECVRFLVRSGADVTLFAEDPTLGPNCTALHIASAKAAFETDQESVALLIDEKIINAESKCGSALDVAHMHNRYTTANTLRRAGAESLKPNFTDENMDGLPDIDVKEVVFRHPMTLPAKNAPGATVKITVEGDKLTYTLNDEERPSFKQITLYKGTQGLALRFPDSGKSGRQVYLPATGIREIIAGIVNMSEAASIDTNLREEFAELCREGNIPPVRHSSCKESTGRDSPTRRRSSRPAFTCINYPSDTAPFAFTKLRVLAQYEGGMEGEGIFVWLISNNGVDWSPVVKNTPYPDESGCSSCYYVTADEIGCQIKVRGTPVAVDGSQGEPLETSPITIQWPPHLGVAVVDKLVESQMATHVTCTFGTELHHNVYLQLRESILKIKRPQSLRDEATILSGTLGGKHEIRCILSDNSAAFRLEGLDSEEVVNIECDTRQERDFLVAFIRVWQACTDNQMCKSILGGQFSEMWDVGLLKADEAIRVDKIWGAFEEPHGGQLLHNRQQLPRTPFDEDRQALIALRKGFSSGMMRRPPTNTRPQGGLPLSPEPNYDHRMSVDGCFSYGGRGSVGGRLSICTLPPSCNTSSP